MSAVVVAAYFDAASYHCGCNGTIDIPQVSMFESFEKKLIKMYYCSKHP